MVLINSRPRPSGRNYFGSLGAAGSDDGVCTIGTSAFTPPDGVRAGSWIAPVLAGAGTLRTGSPGTTGMVGTNCGARMTGSAGCTGVLEAVGGTPTLSPGIPT